MKVVFYCFSVLYLTVFFHVNAQGIRLYASSQGAVALDSNKDTLLNPWCGGWVNPQFSNIDLNGDGLQDIFVFEPGIGDNRVLTFLNVGGGQYIYAPDYETLFPPLQYWALLVDYNHDGKPDIFTFSSSPSTFQEGMDVYENISDQNGLKFKKVTQNLLRFTDNSNNHYPIFASTSDIPIITDIDGDGDIDIIAFDQAQLGAFWYKNNAAELGYNPDSLIFTNPTMCWGKFSQTTALPPIRLQYGCGKMVEAHGSSSLLAIDLDNDGDKDLLYGNIYVNGLEQLTNGRIRNGLAQLKNDTMTSFSPAIIGSGNIISLGSYPCPFSIEATGDSLDDVVVAPGDYTNDPQEHKTWLYKNTGTAQGNHFQFVTDNFLQGSMVDEGEHSAPAFFDYNHDGLMDLIIAGRANPSNGYEYDHLSLYKNIGTPNEAVFEKVDNDFVSVEKYRLAYTAPAFGDIDGDGRPDMLLGRQDGKVMFFKNISDSGGTLQMKLVSSDLQGITTGSYSAPCLAHISSDTLFDLVLGCDSGNFIYYKNTGTKTSPVFTKITNNFGNVRTNVFYWGNYKYDVNGNIIDSSLVMEPDGRSAPVITDIDHDGKLDMVSGSKFGEMFFWFDITDSLKTRGTFARTDTVFYNAVKHAKEDKYLGYYTMPATADLNNDQFPELLVGNYMGGTMFYGSKQVLPVIYKNIIKSPAGHALVFDVYPNPAHQSINLVFADKGEKSFRLGIVNLLGKKIYAADLSAGKPAITLDISHLASGVYFIQVQDGKGFMGVKKIVVE